MAEVEDALFTAVTGDATVTALIGVKMFPHAAPPGTTLPYIAYERISSVRPQAMQTEPGNVRARFEFRMVDSTPIKARALGKAVRDVLNRHQAPAGTPVIDDIFLDAESAEGGEMDEKRFQVVHDYLVFYTES
jgi:hypothetical protein